MSGEKTQTPEDVRRKRREYMAEYRRKNPEKARKYSADYKKANKEKVSAYWVRYRVETPERYKATRINAAANLLRRNGYTVIAPEGEKHETD